VQGLRHNTPNTPSHSLVSSHPLRVPMMSPVKLAGRKTGENVGKFEDSPIVFCTCTDVFLIGQIIYCKIINTSFYGYEEIPRCQCVDFDINQA